MDFARRQMEKYGWKDGEGLGKDGTQGITVALKPRYKTGKEGMGFDIAKELVDTWWTRSYSDSLNRINISSSDGDKVIVSIPDDDSINDDRPMAKMRKRMLKANFTDFTKGAILSKGEMVEEDEDGESIVKIVPERKTSFPLTDEELLKACGGRTAHKAARFGMKLSGKLARIASQEENNSLSLANFSDKMLFQAEVKRKKSKKPKENVNKQVSDELLLESDDRLTGFPETAKRKRKKKCIEDEEMNTTENPDTILEEHIEDKLDKINKRKKKSKKSKKKKESL